MFEQTFVDARARSARPWMMALSLGLQGALVGVLLVVPLLHPEILRPKLDMPLWVPLQRLKRQPVAEVQKARQMVASSVARPRFDEVFHAPARIPQSVEVDADAPELQNFAMVGSVGMGVGTSTIAGVSGTLPEMPVVKPKPEIREAPKAVQAPLHVSLGVQSAKLTFGPAPLYPAPAKAARVQGMVRLQAVIAVDGSIRNLQVMSGPALLVKAALDAVGRWRYQPTLLSGNPVEVITEIDVNFTLSQ